ncbi:uncharacterized protein LOC101864152 [Aplysia californica]|uniref:Uncharacterized protein LOC101864152 n=1 Tax=Aplysia californica TaxID=6500 RepID=A0ABM0JSG3_APLCA|nr:uncharacterized protein LOC101864152 [Aplysia californica]
MGPEAEKILSTFGLSQDDSNVFNTVLTMFDGYFSPKRNVIHERAQFHKRCKKETETIEEYVRSLYELSEHTAFPDKDNMIRDRLVLGITDKKLSEKLQLEPYLTLEKAITMTRQTERVKAQIKEQRLPNVDAVQSFGSRTLKHGSVHGGPRRGSALRGRGGSSDQQDVRNCQYCGGSHGRQQCPAYGKTCRECSKKNHFAKMCHTRKKINEVKVEDEEEEEAYLLSIETKSNGKQR